MFGIDYAWGDPGVTALKKAGVKFVCRYVSTPGNSKNLTPSEARVLLGGGIPIVVVFETVAGRAKGGAFAGRVDAVSANRQAADCGLVGIPIYFAVDFDATPQDQVAINAYLAAASQVLGKDRVGVYGGYYVVKRALDAGVCKYAWQTYAWSGGQWDPRAHLQQYNNGQRINGVSCDFDRSMKDDFGQYPRPRPTPPPPTPQEDDMDAWVAPWLKWYLGDRDPAKRPKAAPEKIPAAVWEVEKVAVEMRDAAGDADARIAELKAAIGKAREALAIE